MIRSLVPCLLLVAAACASPQQACIADQTGELEILDTLIARDQATLARGYAIEERTEYRRALSLCTGFGRGFGDVGIGTSTCVRPEPRTRFVPVAVNLDEVRARLATLQEKRTDLAREVELGVAGCRAAYPEG